MQNRKNVPVESIEIVTVDNLAKVDENGIPLGISAKQLWLMVTPSDKVDVAYLAPMRTRAELGQFIKGLQKAGKVVFGDEE